MAGGGNHPKASTHNKSSSSSSHRKTRWDPTADKKPSTITTAAADSSKPAPSSNSTPNQNPTTKPAPIPSPNPKNLPTDPTPKSGPFLDSNDALPPPAYGFHMLDRRTIALADGSVRSYFALPPDYHHFAPPPPQRPPPFPRGPELAGPGLGFDNRFPPLGPMSPEFHDREDRDRRNQEYWNSLGLEGNSLKRRFGDEGERGWREEREGKEGKDEFARQRQQLLQYGNAGLNPNGFPVGPGEFMVGSSSQFSRDAVEMGRIDELRAAKYMRVGGGFESMYGRQGGVSDGNVGLKHNEVDQGALKKAFLHYVKLINENVNQKKNYLENGKQARLQCVACGRSSKDFPDMHSLIMHAYNPDRADLLVDHLGLHKALCVLMGWNHLKSPDNSKAYQSLSANEAAANQDDLIIWPPVVIIHNTNTGKVKEGRMEGLGNKVMDNKLRDLGFGSGKAKSVYSKDGHLGITLVKFASDQSGFKEAVRLAEFFEKESHGRKDWTRVQSSKSGKEDENNPNLVKLDEKTGEKNRIFYGYLGTVSDLDKLEFETRKKVTIESRREYLTSK